LTPDPTGNDFPPVHWLLDQGSSLLDPRSIAQMIIYIFHNRSGLKGGGSSVGDPSPLASRRDVLAWHCNP